MGRFFMNIIVNGNKHNHQGNGSLEVLLKEIGAKPLSVAVTVNDQVIPLTKHNDCILKEGDRVEILSFMGGG